MNTLAAGLMQKVILGTGVTSIIGIVGTNLVIGTITTTTSSISSIIRYLMTNEQPGINEITAFLVTSDLEFTIKIIEELVKEQQDKQLTDSVKYALFGVNEILDQIHSELDGIKDAIDVHKKKYLNSWRVFSYNGNIEKLKGENLILKNRYGILIDLLKINK